MKSTSVQRQSIHSINGAIGNVSVQVVLNLHNHFIMANQLVRDHWEYLRKIERHFPIKVDQPIRMALTIFELFSKFPN